MKAIIIAGGYGNRLRPLTDNIPKPMVSVCGKPILFHIIELLRNHGISEFILALCYLPEVITSYFGDGSKLGVKIQYTFENTKTPLGTAGAISLAKKMIKDTFIVTYADILRELDIKKMIDFHIKTQAFATLNVYRRKSVGAKSMVIMDKNQRITEFIERPKSTKIAKKYIWANGSFYIFEPEVFSLIPTGKNVDFGSDIFPKMLKLKKSIFAYPSDGSFVDIGNSEKLKLAEGIFKKE